MWREAASAGAGLVSLGGVTSSAPCTLEFVQTAECCCVGRCMDGGWRLLRCCCVGASVMHVLYCALMWLLSRGLGAPLVRCTRASGDCISCCFSAC